ncbi:MAG TPA: hypothetical protein VFR02_01240, partial [bacterium]|nr:hypothetical protein [bacterium]
MNAVCAWWKRLAAEEAEEILLFQAERARILRALLLLGWLMTTFFMALTLVKGRHFPWLPLVTDSDLLALAFWVERRPQDHRWISRLLLFPAVAFILVDAAGWPPDLLAPALVFLPTLAYFAVLLDGPRAGLVMAVLEAAGLLFYDLRNPLPGREALIARTNLLLVVPGYLVLGWVAWGRFRDLGRAVTAR